MSRMIAIGPERFTVAFGALGFERLEVGPEDFADTIEGLLGDTSVGLIVCGESCLPEDRREAFEQVYLQSPVTVLFVPDGPEARGVAYEITRLAIEHAAGVDLLSSVEAEGLTAENAEDAEGG
jgi:vacuolar-type H+-ATPase subunit F/Vma7